MCGLLSLHIISSGPCKANTTGGICVSVLCEDRMAGKGRSEPSRSSRLCTVERLVWKVLWLSFNHCFSVIAFLCFKELVTF